MITLKIVEKMAEKMKWEQRFFTAYKGGLLPISDVIFSSLCKFLVAVEDGKELGFMRLSDYSRKGVGYLSEEFWSISDAYVKPRYRGKGVLREMISQAVRDHSVKMLFIETSRLAKNYDYYSTLGFSDVKLVEEGKMAYVRHVGTHKVRLASNDAQYKICA